MLNLSRSCLAVLVAFLAPTIIAAPPSFPGAEGFGSAASGGRGKPVVYVTNLNDDGPGSLREALSGGDRNVLFRVSGTIELKSRLNVTGRNITIAGESAPGDGICLRGKEMLISGRNIIVRFMRFRPGDELGEEHDALTLWDTRDVIVDHCSLSWSTDSLNDVVKGSSNVTIQWCILSEPLNQSVHVKGRHGYGTGWASGSYHHNLLAHCDSRTPRLAAPPTRGLTDVRNNVIYNWGYGWAYGAERADVNLIANYYKPGPSSEHNNCFFNVWEDTCRLYLADNVMADNPPLTENNQRGVISEGLVRDNVVTMQGVLLERPFPVVDYPITTHDAEQAYELVLAQAGAIAPKRDAVDRRIVQSVRDGTGKIIDSPAEVGGWPKLTSSDPPIDSDGDGIPDEWERQRGLDPRNAEDAQMNAGDGYSHLEAYLHGLARRAISEP